MIGELRSRGTYRPGSSPAIGMHFRRPIIRIAPVKKRVLVAADVGEGFLERLQANEAFEVRHEELATEDALAAAVGDVDALVTRHHNRVTRHVIRLARSLELIAQGTSGLDNIDREAAAERQISVIGLPGQNANAVAELVLGHIIALTRSVPLYSEMVRAGRWERNDCANRRELSAHVLGIVGIGRVGSRVARLARALGMTVIAYDPYLTVEEISARGAESCPTLDDLLRRCDIVTLHVPLTTETSGMLGDPQLDLMKDGSIVINTSRGPVVDQQSLFARLNTGALGGAALDVYETEPPRADLSWPDRSRLILTPHIAGCSREARSSIGRMLYQRICDFYGLPA
jgi:D-3-phosphoglycerate dehydrogenase